MINEGVIFCICRYLDIGVFHCMVILFNDYSGLGQFAKHTKQGIHQWEETP